MPRKLLTDDDYAPRYPLVGEYIGPKVIAFELRVEDFVDKFSLGPELPIYDPNYYYITSGDAIHKAKYMRKVLENYLEDENADRAAIKKAIGQVDDLLAALRRSKGDGVHMETDRKNGVLIVVSKNPRPRPLATTQNQKQYRQY